MTNSKLFRERRDEILNRDYLHKRLIIEGATVADVSRESGYSERVVHRRLTKLGVRKPKVDLVGQVFGMLTVISRVEKKGRAYWNCLCECGQEKAVSGGNLSCGRTKSCGCVHFKTGPRKPQWKGFGDISGSYWCGVTHGAKNRDIELSVTIEDAWVQFLKQDGRCALTGWKIRFATTQDDKLNRTASFDRINSELGYVPGNIQWIHVDVNRIKNYFPEEFLFRMCRSIVDFRKVPEYRDADAEVHRQLPVFRAIRDKCAVD